jgi:hypothetical protein
MKRSKARLARIAVPAALVAGITSVSVVGLPTAAQATPLCTGLGTTIICAYTTVGHDTTTITVKVKITANKGTLVKSKATVSPSDSTPADNTSVDFALAHKK